MNHQHIKFIKQQWAELQPHIPSLIPRGGRSLNIAPPLDNFEKTKGRSYYTYPVPIVLFYVLRLFETKRGGVKS